jgi:hypothetical protein
MVERAVRYSCRRRPWRGAREGESERGGEGGRIGRGAAPRRCTNSDARRPLGCVAALRAARSTRGRGGAAGEGGRAAAAGGEPEPRAERPEEGRVRVRRPVGAETVVRVDGFSRCSSYAGDVVNPRGEELPRPRSSDGQLQDEQPPEVYS